MSHPYTPIHRGDGQTHPEKEDRRGVHPRHNGFCTPGTLRRLLDFTSLFSFEIKALSDELHRNLTGAPSEPVLRNAGYLAGKFPERIRIFRTVVIPGINHHEIPEIAGFLAEINPEIPYRLIGFRPNFMLYYHRGPERRLMERLVEECRAAGLKRVDYSGHYPLLKADLESILRGKGCDLPGDSGSCSHKGCGARSGSHG